MGWGSAGSRRSSARASGRGKTGGCTTTWRCGSGASPPPTSTGSPSRSARRPEWDRTQLASFGVENKRLYELRIQVPSSKYTTDEGQLQEILDSFELFTMEPGKTMI